MDKDRDLLIERLTHEAGSWKSIELKTNQDFVNSSGSQDPSMYQRAIYHEDYIETVLGQRFDRCLDVPAGGVEKLAEYYCDGVKRADVSFDAGAGSKQSQINIKKSFKYEAHYGMNFRPFPLRYLYYVGNIPLPRALKDAETLGPATVLGRPCETFLLRRFTLGLSPCDLGYTLDRESGVPLKLVGYNDAAGYTGGRPSWRWEALGVEQVQGHLFPAKSEEIVYFPPPDAKAARERDRSSEVCFQTTHVVEAIRFEGDYPRTTFWPVIAPEANVFDSITRKVTSAKVRPVVAQVANPIRAEVPWGWSETMPAVGVGLGVVLVLVGLIARRGGRRISRAS